MLRMLVEKVVNMQEQMANISRKMEILRQNKKEILEIKITATEMKNAFDGLTSRVDTAKEIISELEHLSIENSN